MKKESDTRWKCASAQIKNSAVVVRASPLAQQERIHLRCRRRCSRGSFDPRVRKTPPGGGHGNPLQGSCWRIPGTEEPEWPQYIVLQGVRRDRSDLAGTHTCGSGEYVSKQKSLHCSPAVHLFVPCRRLVGFMATCGRFLGATRGVIRANFRFWGRTSKSEKMQYFSCRQKATSHSHWKSYCVCLPSLRMLQFTVPAGSHGSVCSHLLLCGAIRVGCKDRVR